MNVKILMLKSNEDVIAEVNKLTYDHRKDEYLLKNPYCIFYNDHTFSNVMMYRYAPFAKDNTLCIDPDWVISEVEPNDQILNAYLEAVNGKTDSSN